MHWFAALFLLLLLVSTAVRSWLNQRQIDAVSLHRDRVPAAFAAQIDLDSHRKAADYTVALARLSRWDILVDTLLVVLLTFGGGIDAIDGLWRTAGLPELWLGTAVVLSLVLLIMVLNLPFSIYRTFGIEARFGFNRTTPGLFIADLLKALGLMLLLGTPLLYVILFLMQHAGQLWWLYAWAVWLVAMLLITWAWPVVFAPLFDKFTPLADEALKQRTEALVERCGFSSRGVFVMNGSRRSTHGNAYFIGLGRNKRIVFFDTLLQRLSGSQIEAVLAHELGHFRLHHVRRRTLLTLALGLGGFALLGVLAAWPDFYRILGVSTPSGHAALLLFMLVLPTFTFFVTPLGAWWSRRHEFEADEFALRFIDAGELVDALVHLYRDNATSLTPDPLHSAFYDSHPPAPIRIARLRQTAPGTT